MHTYIHTYIHTYVHTHTDCDRAARSRVNALQWDVLDHEGCTDTHEYAAFVFMEATPVAR